MAEEERRPGYHLVIRKDATGKVVSRTWVKIGGSAPAQKETSGKTFRKEEERSKRETLYGFKPGASDATRKLMSEGQKRHSTRTRLPRRPKNT